MNISFIVVAIYVAILFCISFYARKKASSGAEGYILAGRGLNTTLITVTMVGLAIGGSSTIGVAEQAYKVGLSAGWYTVAWGVGSILMGLIGAKKYRQLNVSTVPEMFERFYDTKGRIVCVIGQIVIQLMITSLQYIAGGAILSSLLPAVFTLKTGMITTAVVFIGITFIGGMWSTGLCNLFNVPLKYMGVIVVTVLAVAFSGGIHNMALKVPNAATYFHPVDGLGLPTIIVWFIVMITECFSLQGVVQVSFCAKDADAARKGYIIGGLLMIPIGFFAAMLGMVARVSYPGVSATMALPMVITSLNPLLAGITLAALWAADISTACNMLLGSATLFSHDIYKRFINENIGEKELMKITKFFVVILGVVTFFIAIQAKGILSLLMMALSLTTAFSIVFIFTTFAPSICRKNSAFNTAVAGIIVLVVWQLVPAVRILPHVIYAEWIVCLITFLITPLFDRKTINALEGIEVALSEN
ncbi:sodium:solute symporter family protein [Clostridium scatologenes]|uniref:Na+/solute symporter n=1 Tax=Clostridium scatologenes TaxID=1548 RepID=A0A0E3GQB8_CLOSL|nr:sodium:solute symporter family protein [Clostridium scatologenes]AKA68296.1 Na+/solute symporter [Clostridium scatologenes]